MVASKTRPRIIIHGGAGNITRQNLAPEAYHSYRNALLSILEDSHSLLSQPDATALNVATHAVSLLEDNPLFNSGHGAVFTTAGTHELEASVMTSTGHCKRGVGIMLVDRVKNPIKFAREMLLRGEEADGGGAGGHCQLSGDTVHKLAEDWGLDMVSPSYYWTKKRWDEHRKGLGLSTDDETYRKKKHEVEGRSELGFEVADGEYVGVGLSDPSWDGLEYLPQGTVGCVVLDSEGTLCVATSTGGLTNKLPGRIGDTPTIGAGFFAEEWLEESPAKRQAMLYRQPEFVSSSAPRSTNNFCGLLRDCLPSLWSSYTPLLDTETEDTPVMLSEKLSRRRRGIAISGTGKSTETSTISHPVAAQITYYLIRYMHKRVSFTQTPPYPPPIPTYTSSYLSNTRQRRLLPPPLRRPHRLRNSAVLNLANPNLALYSSIPGRRTARYVRRKCR